MYKLNESTIQLDNMSIPLDPANRHYQEMLDEIIEQGADCWDGEIPAEIQAAADAKLFAQQLEAYTQAVARLSQYILSEGQPEIRKDIVIETQEVWDENTREMKTVEITENIIVQREIEPLEPTVEITEIDKETMQSVTETVRNPLIVKDEEERAAAQAVIDATPQAVKDWSN